MSEKPNKPEPTRVDHRPWGSGNEAWPEGYREEHGRSSREPYLFCRKFTTFLFGYPWIISARRGNFQNAKKLEAFFFFFTLSLVKDQRRVRQQRGFKRTGDYV
jgi:hypothetical protein